MERAEKSLDTQEVERLLRSRLDEIQARIAELAKAPEPGSGIGFGKRIGDDRLHETEQWACGMLPLGPSMCGCRHWQASSDSLRLSAQS